MGGSELGSDWDIQPYPLHTGVRGQELPGVGPPGCPLNGRKQVLAYCGIGLVASILGELAAGVWRVPVDLVPQLWFFRAGSTSWQVHLGTLNHPKTDQLGV